jgi:hypothetical protein
MVDCGLIPQWYVERSLTIYKLTDAILELSPEAKRALSEEYSNTINFSDGVIYPKIRQYESSNDKFAKCQWMARLTKSKRDILNRFLKRSSFRIAFDNLLVIRGLWPAGFKIGTLHKTMGMRNPEVSTRAACVEQVLMFSRKSFITQSTSFLPSKKGFFVESRS